MVFVFTKKVGKSELKGLNWTSKKIEFEKCVNFNWWKVEGAWKSLIGVQQKLEFIIDCWTKIFKDDLGNWADGLE